MIDRRMLALCAAALACGCEKKPAPESAAIPPAAAEAPALPAAPSSAVTPSKAPDSLSAKGTPAPAPQLRDSAFGPTAEVDERGNVKPIKRP